MSASTRPEAFEAPSRGTALLWLGVLGVVACTAIAAAVFVFSPPLAGASNAITTVQLRSRQLGADSLALGEAVSEGLLARFSDQYAKTDNAVSDLIRQHGNQLDAGSIEALDAAWQSASGRLAAQSTQATQLLRSRDVRRGLARQLDEAHAIGLSLARAVMSELDLGPAERVAWLQWPVTLGELRLQLRASEGDLAADLAAPVSSALADTQNLLAGSDGRLAPRARASLETVHALLETESNRFAGADTPEVLPPAVPQGFELRGFSDALGRAASALEADRARWRNAGLWAAGLGVVALILLALSAVFRRDAAPEDALETPLSQQPESDAVRRMADDSKRDYGIARALARTTAKRLSQLGVLTTDAEALSGHAARLAKPRELVLRLGRQHAASQRTLTNQMATTTARLSDVSKLARQWAERSDESHRLLQSMRELGERAALLQVNARIRVGDADAGLAEDFQRLNDSVLKVTAQTETLARRQSDASRRTLDGLGRSVESQSATESTASMAASQLRAYVNGQEDLSGRYDKLDGQLSGHADALSALHEQAKADQVLEQRALKASRAAAHFANRVGQSAEPATSDTVRIPPARSAPRRARRPEIESAEADG